MKNEKHKIDKWIFGIVVGGLISGAGFFLWKASSQERKSFLHKIEKVISAIAHSLQGIDIEKAKGAIEEIKKEIPKQGHISHALSMMATGINIWKKVSDKSGSKKTRK